MGLGLVAFWVAAHLLGCGASEQVRAQTGGDGLGAESDSETNAPAGGDAAVGAALYGQYCSLCHGANGEGYVADNAPALANPAFLASASDDFLSFAVEQGRPGTTMSAWGLSGGGPLDDGAILDLVAHLRTWQQGEAVAVDGVEVDGLASRGRPLYNALCAECHGDEGTGEPYVQLANPWLLETASDGFLRYAIEAGRPGTPMPAFGEALTTQNLDDLVVLIRSWAVPPGSPPPVPAAPDLEHALLHPTGQVAAFTLKEERYVAADDVYAALTAGQSFVLLDARPPGDYASSHIEGAVNLPFYDVEAYAHLLPSNVWIVAYCGCPHAVSGQAVDALRAAGFAMSAVLDEGFYVWEERGYPVVSGSADDD